MFLKKCGPSDCNDARRKRVRIRLIDIFFFRNILTARQGGR